MQTVRVSDVVDHLVALGLGRTDAQAYVHLSMAGPTKAGDVATALKVPRTEAYRTLQRLVDAGFADQALGRPIRFEAKPPEEVFRLLVEAERARLEQIERARTSVATALTTLRASGTADLTKNTFRIVQGRPDIYREFDRMIRAAKREFLTVTTHHAAYSMAETVGLWDTLLARADEGVRFRSVIQSTPETRAVLAARVLRSPSVEMRHFASERPLRFVIRDEEELLILVVNDPSKSAQASADVAIWTDARDFVHAELELFDRLWKDGVDLRAMVEADAPADG